MLWTGNCKISFYSNRISLFRPSMQIRIKEDGHEEVYREKYDFIVCRFGSLKSVDYPKEKENDL